MTGPDAQPQTRETLVETAMQKAVWLHYQGSKSFPHGLNECELCDAVEVIRAALSALAARLGAVEEEVLHFKAASQSGWAERDEWKERYAVADKAVMAALEGVNLLAESKEAAERERDAAKKRADIWKEECQLDRAHAEEWQTRAEAAEARLKAATDALREIVNYAEVAIPASNRLPALTGIIVAARAVLAEGDERGHEGPTTYAEALSDIGEPPPSQRLAGGDGQADG